MSLNLRTISSLFITGLVLLLSSGVTVYVRTCDDGCESVVSIDSDQTKCHKEEAEVTDACCAKPKEQTKKVEKSCCSKIPTKSPNEKSQSKDKKGCCNSDSFSLDFDFFGFFNKVELNPQLVSFNAPVFLNERLSFSDIEKYYYTDLPPPKLLESSSTILLSKNAFLI